MSLSVSSERAYSLAPPARAGVASVEWMRFFPKDTPALRARALSAQTAAAGSGRCQHGAGLGEGHPEGYRDGVRVRGSSRSSRRSPGGIQTAGRGPRGSRVARPAASSLSDLWAWPILDLALAAGAGRGRQPAFWISSTIQYQLPTVSRATGVPGGNWERKARMAPGSWLTRVRWMRWPRRSRTENSE